MTRKWEFPSKKRGIPRKDKEGCEDPTGAVSSILIRTWMQARLLPSTYKIGYSIASVMSDSLQPCGLWPARLLCPWDSPGRNSEVGTMPSSRASSWPRDRTCISCFFCIVRWILYPLSHQGSPLIRLLTKITRLFLHCRVQETEAQIYLKSPHKDSNLEWKPRLWDENLQRATRTWNVFKTKLTWLVHFTFWLLWW